MPGILGDAADAMRRAAEEKAKRERERRRKHLQNQINDWNGKLSKATPLRDALIKERDNLGSYLSEWEAQKNKCDGNLLLSEIVITNRFEGESADEIKKDFTASVEEMNTTYLKTGRLRDSVSLQITRLNQYISSINEKISSLTRELNAI